MDSEVFLQCTDLADETAPYDSCTRANILALISRNPTVHRVFRFIFTSYTTVLQNDAQITWAILDSAQQAARHTHTYNYNKYSHFSTSWVLTERIASFRVLNKRQITCLFSIAILKMLLRQTCSDSTF